MRPGSYGCERLRKLVRQPAAQLCVFPAYVTFWWEVKHVPGMRHTSGGLWAPVGHVMAHGWILQFSLEPAPSLGWPKKQNYFLRRSVLDASMCIFNREKINIEIR